MTTASITKHTCNDGHGPHFGKKTVGCPRCDELLAGASARSWNSVASYNQKVDETYRNSQRCVGHAPQLNPGGYCNICGKGRDFS